MSLSRDTAPAEQQAEAILSAEASTDEHFRSLMQRVRLLLHEGTMH